MVVGTVPIPGVGSFVCCALLRPALPSDSGAPRAHYTLVGSVGFQLGRHAQGVVEPRKRGKPRIGARSCPLGATAAMGRVRLQIDRNASVWWRSKARPREQTVLPRGGLPTPLRKQFVTKITPAC
jgi:hypothetical protein